MWPKNNVRKHLPFPEGPFIPGCIDIMTEYSSDGTLLRLFYPSDLKASSKEGWIPWLFHKKYLEGLALALKIWKFLFKLMCYLFSVAEKYVPVMWQSDVSRDKEKFPVVVFSHGWSAARYFYSTMCAELASHGFVVAAVEHRDGSSCISFYYESPEHKNLKKPTWIYPEAVGFGEKHLHVRKSQVMRRATECCKVVKLLEKINAGVSIENLLEESLALSQFKGKLDMSNLVMMGHSFGGATALLTLSMEPKFKVGVILDAWMFPLKDDDELPDKVKQPLFFINTQTFQILSNVKAMKKYLRNGENDVLTIRNTTHEQQTDSPYILGLWLNLFMKKLDSPTATKINNHLILEFLKNHIDIPHLPDKDLYLNAQAHNILQGFVINKERRGFFSR